MLLALAELEGWGTYDAALSEEEGRDPAVERGAEHGVRGIGGSDDGGVVARRQRSQSTSVFFPTVKITTTIRHSPTARPVVGDHSRVLPK